MNIKALSFGIAVLGVSVILATPALAQTATSSMEASTTPPQQEIDLEDLMRQNQPKASPYGKPLAGLLIVASVVGFYLIEKRTN